jgi:hypothetical protein
MSIRITGNAKHVLHDAIVEELLKQAWVTPTCDVIIDLSIGTAADDVGAMLATRNRVTPLLCALARHNDVRTHFLHVIAHGDANDAALVLQFRRDFGLNATVVNLGILYGAHVPSIVEDVIDDVGSRAAIRVLDGSDTFFFSNIHTAATGIVAAVRSAEYANVATVNVMDSRATHTLAGFATAVSKTLRQSRVHLRFTNPDAEDAAVFVSN